MTRSLLIDEAVRRVRAKMGPAPLFIQLRDGAIAISEEGIEAILAEFDRVWFIGQGTA